MVVSFLRVRLICPVLLLVPVSVGGCIKRSGLLLPMRPGRGTGGVCGRSVLIWLVGWIRTMRVRVLGLGRLVLGWLLRMILVLGILIGVL